MDIKTKLKIDKLVGIPIIFVLNITAKTLGFILKPEHSFTLPPKNIVVCKFHGMGSIIQATLLLQTLRKNFSNTQITFVTSISNLNVLTQIPFINNIIIINDNSVLSLLISSIKLIIKLWCMKVNLYIDLEIYSYYSSIIATLSIARNRIGFYRKESNIRLGIYTHMIYFNNKATISSVYLQTARLVGCSTIINNLYKFKIDKRIKTSLNEKLNSFIKFNPDSKIIVINSNASDLRIERRWPLDNFVKLIEQLIKTFPNYNYILVGAKNEQDYVNCIHTNISDEIRSRVFDTSGKLNLHELIALIEASSIFISNDTGPMHIAFALNKMTIALFGPCSPSQYGKNQNTICIYKNLYCSPCVHEFLTPPCKGDNQCMKMITVNEVLKIVKKLMSK